MEGGIRLISKEMIKPSSPTPHHLHNYPLSFLDQLFLPIYGPFVFFYRSTDNRPEIQLAKSDLLKRSLSRVLSLYYPLAGCIKTNDQNARVVVDCNDRGVLYQEAEASFRIDDVLLNKNRGGASGEPPCARAQGPPKFKGSTTILPPPTNKNDVLYDRLLNKLIPLQPEDHRDRGPLLGVQFSTFRCGGVAVGISMSHKLADGWSNVWFVKTWADIARGDHRADTIMSPELIGSELFPPRDVLGFVPAVRTYEGAEKKKFVTRRFLFRKESIASLRKIYASTGTDNNVVLVPSRVQTLTAFIWSRFMAATKSTTSNSKDNTGVLTQTVNLRSRMEPKLPDNSFGNYYRSTIAFPTDDHNLISQLKDSIAKIDYDHYIKDLQEGNHHLDMMIKRSQQRLSTVESKDRQLGFTSLCGFPLYEVDFGWGKPAKTGHPRMVPVNLVMLVPASESGDEIEAIVTLGEDDMAKFREDGELLRYASSFSVGEFVGRTRL